MKKPFLKFFAVSTFMALSISIQAQEAEKAKFEPTDQSLQQYKYPDWFRDAKFGIWAHWGPQAVPRQGDWYARNMYLGPGYVDRKTLKVVETGHWAYESHLKKYGHPSVFGYKDIIQLWKAERFNPEELIALYKKVGAKYFMSMAVHHDNFFLWNSNIHKWNSVNMGPKKDVVGLWQKAAQKAGLHFGVSEHLAASYTWFQSAHSSDKTGEKAGVPYDGNNLQYADLYHEKAADDDKGWMTKNPVWQKEWLNSITELVDKYKPDLIYSDCAIPFGNEVGRSLIAHFYNEDMQKNKGKLDAVYFCKEPSKGRFVRDVEKGVLDSISDEPWQTDTSVGDWFYKTGQKYKTADEVIQLLVDVVSKNGNLLLNVVQTPEGELEPDILQILDGIGNWTQVNGEAIYGSRPWKIYGEGPTTLGNQEVGPFGGLKDVRTYQETDIRFTTKNNVLYVFCMNTPTKDIQVNSLGKLSKYANKAITSISILGSKEKIQWKQENISLTIKFSKQTGAKVVVYAIGFKK